MPGNDLALTRDAEKELLKFERGIEKLLPEEARKQLHVMTADELFSPDSREESDDSPAER